MKQITILAAFTALLLIGYQAEAQKVFGTRNGRITFESPTDGDVKAVNNEVTSRIADNGQLTFSLLIKGFKFKMAEMQEHFNDQYAESSKFPRADFKGTITNLKDVNFTKDGSYKASFCQRRSDHAWCNKKCNCEWSSRNKGRKTSSTWFIRHHAQRF